MPADTDLQVTWGTRLWYAWVILWTGIMTVPCAIGQILSHLIRPQATTFQWWARRWSRGIFKGAGVRVVVHQEASFPADQPYVILSNHQNSYDIPALAAVLPVPFGFVAKTELQRIPFLGTAVRFSPSVFLDRSDRRKSMESMKVAAERIRSGSSVLVYPEGGRSFQPALRPFKRGAFYLAIEAGVPLLPVTVIDAYRLLDERSYTARPGTLNVVIGKPIPVAGLNRRDIPALMEAVRSQMEAALRNTADAVP